MPLTPIGVHVPLTLGDDHVHFTTVRKGNAQRAGIHRFPHSFAASDHLTSQDLHKLHEVDDAELGAEYLSNILRRSIGLNRCQSHGNFWIGFELGK